MKEVLREMIYRPILAYDDLKIIFISIYEKLIKDKDFLNELNISNFKIDATNSKINFLFFDKIFELNYDIFAFNNFLEYRGIVYCNLIKEGDEIKNFFSFTYNRDSLFIDKGESFFCDIYNRYLNKKLIYKIVFHFLLYSNLISKEDI